MSCTHGLLRSASAVAGMAGHGVRPIGAGLQRPLPVPIERYFDAACGAEVRAWYPMAFLGWMGLACLEKDQWMRRSGFLPKLYPGAWPFLLLISLLVPIWVGVVWTNRQSEQQGLNEIRQETSALALLFATHTDVTFRTVDLALMELRDRWLQAPRDSASAIEPHLQLLGDAVVQTGVIDAAGYMAYSTPLVATLPTSFADREFFKVHQGRNEDRLYVGRPIEGRLSGKWSIPLTRPILKNGQFAGVVVIQVNPDYFVNFYQSAGLGRGGAARMIRDTGDIMVRSSDQEQFVGKIIKPTPYADPGAPLQGSFRRKAQADGVDRLSSYYRLPAYGLTVVIGPSVDERLAPVRAHQRQLLWAAFAVTVLILLSFALLVRGARRVGMAQKALSDSERRFRSLFDSMSEGVALHRIVNDSHGQAVDYEILGVNPAFEAMTGRTREQVVGKRMTQAYGVAAAPFLDIYAEVARSGQSTSFEQHLDILGKDVAVSVFSPEKGQFAVVFEDISDRKRLEALREADHQKLEQQFQDIVQLQDQLQQQVRHDPMTGLANRRFLDEVLPRELARATREGYPVCFVMLDLDHFKLVNDTHGHAYGDIVLVTVAGILTRSARETDFVFRLGGEEFLMVMPQLPLETARQKIEAIRKNIESTAVAHQGVEVHITVSAGIAEFPTHATGIEDLIRRADVALYQSKHGGRNRVSVAS